MIKISLDFISPSSFSSVLFPSAARVLKTVLLDTNTQSLGDLMSSHAPTALIIIYGLFAPHVQAYPDFCL